MQNHVIGSMFKSFHWVTLDSSQAGTGRKAYPEPQSSNKPTSWAGILDPAPRSPSFTWVSAPASCSTLRPKSPKCRPQTHFAHLPRMEQDQCRPGPHPDKFQPSPRHRSQQGFFLEQLKGRCGTLPASLSLHP